MDRAELVEMQRKVSAALELGLTVDTEYSMVGEVLVATLQIKKDGETLESYPSTQDKTKVLAQLNATKTQLQAQIAEVDATIAKVNGAGGA